MILLLETATDSCSIGISQDGQLVSLAEIHERADHAARINELILRVCKEAACTLAGIDAVAISRGPGSYTSLRVGTATAKGICFALDKPLIAVDTLAALARAARQADTGKWLYAPMIDARRMEVYTAFYDRDFQLVKAAHALIIDSECFAELQAAGYQIVLSGNGAAKCKSILSDSILFPQVNCSAAHLVALAHQAFQNQAFEDIAYFEPFYLKPPNITQAKKRL